MSELKKYFKIKWLIISIFTSVSIFFITHIPQKFMPNRLGAIGIDKIGHIVAYGIITLLFIISLRSSLSLFSIVILFFAISCFGVIDELTQPLVNRAGSLLDWFADIIGISVVLFSFLYFQSSKCQ